MQTIRSFSSADLDKVMEIEKSAFLQPWPKSEFEKHKTGFFVTEENNEVIGFILGEISDHQGIIKKIAVSENNRGKGVGQALLEHLSVFFKAKGAKELVARSRVTNLASISFLKKAGFETSKTIEKYYLDGTDAYLLKKNIQGN
ncbi:MAG: ribosomal protein S18-alanine N-acetyltransferase [Candidatus Nealsonbacteria bacterium]